MNHLLSAMFGRDLLFSLFSPLTRRELEGKKVVYCTRWSDEERYGTITRVKDTTLWIGPRCLHHRDLTVLQEVL